MTLINSKLALEILAQKKMKSYKDLYFAWAKVNDVKHFNLVHAFDREMRTVGADIATLHVNLQATRESMTAWLRWCGIKDPNQLGHVLSQKTL